MLPRVEKGTPFLPLKSAPCKLGNLPGHCLCVAGVRIVRTNTLAGAFFSAFGWADELPVSLTLLPQAATDKTSCRKITHY